MSPGKYGKGKEGQNWLLLKELIYIFYLSEHFYVALGLHNKAMNTGLVISTGQEKNCSCKGL
jgi:hypothetical protein